MQWSHLQARGINQYSELCMPISAPMECYVWYLDVCNNGCIWYLLAHSKGAFRARAHEQIEGLAHNVFGSSRQTADVAAFKLAMDSLHEQVTSEDEIQARVTELYDGIGFLLNDLESAVLLVDALSKDYPIVGATRGFTHLTGYTLDCLLGRNCRLMLENLQPSRISRGKRQTLQDFCKMCRVKGLTDAETGSNIVLNSRKDGTLFHNFFVLRLCKIGPHTLILGAQMSLGEGGDGTRPDITDFEYKKEACRDTLKLTREHLIANSPCAGTPQEDSLESSSCCRRLPDFAFYSERLQSNCLLLHNRFMAMRREPTILRRGCLVFGDRPVQHSPEGLSFSLLVQQREVFEGKSFAKMFSGLPLLGFTKRAPKDTPDLYPSSGPWCGASVMVGMDSQAFARDQFEHYGVMDECPSIADLEVFSLDPPPPSDSQSVVHGDVLCCKYFNNGHIALELNDKIIIAFDVGRPIDQNADYYAVVDVCDSVWGVLLVPTEDIFSMSKSAELASRQISCGTQTSSECDLETFTSLRSGFELL